MPASIVPLRSWAAPMRMRCYVRPVSRSVRSTGTSAVRRRFFSCRTTTTISIMTRQPTKPSRFHPTISCCRRRVRRNGSGIRNSCPIRTDRRGSQDRTVPISLRFRPSGLSESFGTLRYGRLAELLLYDVRRTVTLAGPTGVFVAPDVEAWL